MEIITLITNKLQGWGWKVKSVDFETGEVKASKNYLNIIINHEMCSCHGGRLYITSDHTRVHLELTHETYNSELGYNDPESELVYTIENELEEALQSLSTYIYKLTVIGKYGDKDKHDIRYHKNQTNLCADILGSSHDIKDIHMIDSVKITFPNENVYEVVTLIDKKDAPYGTKSAIWFKNERFGRANEREEFKLKEEYEMYVQIFNKKGNGN